MLPVLILYVDQNYQVTYWVIRDGVKLFSQVTIPQAIQLLQNFEFDLIVSDPQKIAILKPASTDSLVTGEGEKKEAFPSASQSVGL